MKQDFIYKRIGDRELTLAYLPPLQSVYAAAPLYFIIPGGGWHMADRDSMIGFSRISVAELRERGFAVVSTEYRLRDEEGVGICDIIGDCFDALKFIVERSGQLGIDPHRIATSGHSAGGHLSLMLAYADPADFGCDMKKSDYTVRVTAPMSAPTALYDDRTHHLGDMRKNFKTQDWQNEAKKGSPIEYVTAACPPTMLSAGTSDRLVYCNSSELLYDKLIACGVPCELLLSVAGGHSFEPMHKGVTPMPEKPEIQNRMTRYILEHIGEEV